MTFSNWSLSRSRSNGSELRRMDSASMEGESESGDLAGIECCQLVAAGVAGPTAPMLTTAAATVVATRSTAIPACSAGTAVLADAIALNHEIGSPAWADAVTLFTVAGDPFGVGRSNSPR